MLIKHFCTKSSALYIEHDSDFEIIQQAFKKVMNSTTKIEFKEFIVSNHEKLLHPAGIEKIKLFKEFN